MKCTGHLEAHGCGQEAGLIDEGQECDALPCKPLAIHVHLEVLWVEIQDGRLRMGEQELVGLGQGMGRGCRQHAHQLIEGLEGIPQGELDVQARQALQVRRKRRIMIRIVPGPGGYTCNTISCEQHGTAAYFGQASTGLNQRIPSLPKA